MGIDQTPFTPAFFTAETECAVPREPSAPERTGESCEAHVSFDPCDSAQSVCLQAACRDQLPGRVLDVTSVLTNVCPGRRSAVGITVTEVDEKGTEHARGFRAVTVPAHHGRHSCDVQLDPVRFILPEDTRLQNRRHFICRLDHHYLDSGDLQG